MKTSTRAVTCDLVFFEPTLMPKIWGGHRLGSPPWAPRPTEGIGEALVFSARPDTATRVLGGDLQGCSLAELWDEHRHLFGDERPGPFPLQVKLIDAGEDLSVQVHPDETFAARTTGADAKTECWYTLAPSHSGRVLIGHTCDSADEFLRGAEAGRWDSILSSKPMLAGDFFVIPAGTPHCLLAGSFVYEVLQSSDTTYRLHDHDRVDRDGRPRELHVNLALEAMSYPCHTTRIPPIVVRHPGGTETHFVRSRHFVVRRARSQESISVRTGSSFALASVVAGSGRVNGRTVVAGDHFLVPAGTARLHIEGRCDVMLVNPGAN